VEKYYKNNEVVVRKVTCIHKEGWECG
jgi:hypothetical protein